MTGTEWMEELEREIKMSQYEERFPKPPPAPKLIRKMRLRDVNEGVPGGLEVRFDALILMFHRLQGRNAVCTVVGGKSDGEEILLHKDTPISDYGEYYEVDL